ncbi:MAG: ATP-grasp domain-containing protein [Planctomycetota bacterium]
MKAFSNVTWVLEEEVFADSNKQLRDAVMEAGADVIRWKDPWIADESWPRLSGKKVIFHGSLNNAAKVADSLPWQPGAYCDTEKFHCSRWYLRAKPWLLQQHWTISTVKDLVSHPNEVLGRIGSPESVFVRPDSPHKPFSGRVASHDDLVQLLWTMDSAATTTGRIVVSRVCPIQKNGGVVVAGEVVAGSTYQADGRKALGDDADGRPWQFAANLAKLMELPQEVCVMDVCESEGNLHLLELNPFSGADLYSCNRLAVVQAVSTFAANHVPPKS